MTPICVGIFKMASLDVVIQSFYKMLMAYVGCGHTQLGMRNLDITWT